MNVSGFSNMDRILFLTWDYRRCRFGDKQESKSSDWLVFAGASG